MDTDSHDLDPFISIGEAANLVLGRLLLDAKEDGAIPVVRHRNRIAVPLVRMNKRGSTAGLDISGRAKLPERKPTTTLWGGIDGRDGRALERGLNDAPVRLRTITGPTVRRGSKFEEFGHQALVITAHLQPDEIGATAETQRCCADGG